MPAIFECNIALYERLAYINIFGRVTYVTMVKIKYDFNRQAEWRKLPCLDGEGRGCVLFIGLKYGLE